MRFNSFKKQSELLHLRLKAIEHQVSTITDADALTPQQTHKLKLLSNTASGKHAEFERLVSKLFSTSPLPDDIDDVAIAKYQDAISDLYISINSICSVLIPPDPKHENDSNNSSDSPAPAAAAPHVSVNLPRLNLPRFSGQPDQWTAFHSLYENAIHKNESISNVEKFTYLLSCLSHEPLGLIKSLPVTHANYLIAWQTLTKRYHNSRLLITLHLNNLLDLNVSSNPSVKQLRHFISTFNENCQALLALGHDVTKESLILTTHITRKFGSDVRSKFEHSRTDSKEMPDIKEFINFLEKECTQLEAANVTHMSQNLFSRDNPGTSKPNSFQNKGSFPKQSKVTMFSSNTQSNCTYCSSPDHNIYKCGSFSSLDVSARQSFIKERNLCQNCFGTHKISTCKSNRNCSTCNKRHHTMLHISYNAHPNVPVNQKCNSSTPPAATALLSHPSNSASAHFTGISCDQNTTVLLATALVVASAPDNNTAMVFRAVLDSASQSTFITENCAQLLKISRSSTKGPMINGVSSTQVKTKGFSHIKLTSLGGTLVSSSQPVIILDRISNDLPKTKVNPSVKIKLKNYVLADPTFDVPSPIDILIGADLFAKCMNGCPLSQGSGMPSIISTVFGFIIIGTAPTVPYQASSNTLITMLTVNDLDIHSSLQRFWSLEEPPQSLKVSKGDEQCEKHFVATHSRNETGRFVCRLPFKSDPDVLGDSSKTAKNMLFALERKFKVNPELKNCYVDFMTEYFKAGHMKLCTSQLPPDKPYYLLPHHGVFKNGKIRVVFNASAPTSNNVSLNDILHPGPKLHNEITDIILKFRIHKIVFSCDIRQMFRNIDIHVDDQRYQLIYWREDASLPIQIFQLTTVTYGMTSSPFLANRVVQQLISVEGHNHPQAASALKRQLFVDDALLGSNSEEEALQLKEDVTNLLRKGGFELRKWASNSNMLLNMVPEDHHEKPIFFPKTEQPCFNILGLKWDPKEDTFSYLISVPVHEVTKRTVLSCIAKIYDPSGWLSPVIVWAKILMQHIWISKVTWDEPLPENIQKKWKKYVSELPLLENIKITRHLGILTLNQFQLHGFSDASESAYAACVYLRHGDNDQNVTVRLLIAKSRVAPLKHVTLPRLELCAALLLAKLIKYCSEQLSEYVHATSIHAWSDSTIVLSWINTPSYRLKVFVANRVAEIQEITPPSVWSHVASQHNPADCASRGTLPSELSSHPLWWEGPSWLKLPPQQWPNSSFCHSAEETIPELKHQTLDTLVTTEKDSLDLLSKFSSWLTVIHVTAYVMRFISCLKIKNKIVGELTLQETDAATNLICKKVQQECFQEDLIKIKNKKPCSQRLQRLSPFLDAQGILRVGGRLKNAPIGSKAKNPILLPKKHHVVNILIDYYHKRNLHVGPQSLQAMLAQQYWILSARSIIRSRIFKCITCFRMKPKMESPLMGDLPSGRVNPGRVFSTSGTDFAGPFRIKIHTLRKTQPVKVYLCLFICFSTKAVHIELVSDLSTEAFLAALSRFVSRRGRINHLHCDCGTNFVGAAASLHKTFQDLMKTPSLQSFALENRISFHFLPPHSPHQGGLWERAVRSAKHHLQRVIGTQVLTYEEFLTLTVRVEAMLNSRPIVPLSADPNDLEPLTPGHFIAGGPLTSILEPDLTHITSNRLRRWQLVQAFSQQIWRRWYSEYLHTLQERPKWNTPKENIKVGDLVIVNEPHTAPLHWKMGRVTAVNPGADGVVRVVHIRTTTGNYSRPAVKISRLPID